MNKKDRCHGELSPGDVVTLTGLRSENGQLYNGKTGVIIASREHGECPTTALRKDGRYTVMVRLKNDTKESAAGMTKNKAIVIKRENMNLVQGNLRTEVLNDVDLNGGTGEVQLEEAKAAELLSKYPTIEGTKVELVQEDKEGLFEKEYRAVVEGDHVTLRECMEHLKEIFETDEPADAHIDCHGNTYLLHAVEHGHAKIVQILFDYGANANAPFGPFNPTAKMEDLSILYVAILNINLYAAKGRTEEREAIVDLLLQNGAEVNKVSRCLGGMLTTLLEFNKPNLHGPRMRIMRKLLEHGVDPNQLIRHYPMVADDAFYVEQLPLVDAIYMKDGGPPEHRIQVIELLLEFGADSGKFKGILNPQGDQFVNAVMAASCQSAPRILEVLLKSEKGRKAVHTKIIPSRLNFLQVLLSNNAFENKNDTSTRESVVMLLKYGADIFQNCDTGRQASHLLESSKQHRELKKIILKAPDRIDKQATLDYWDIEKNEKVKLFVGSSSGHQCPVCLAYSDSMKEFRGGTSSGFMKCSQCLDQRYCSRECQKMHWKYHKTVCKPVRQKKV